MAPRLNYHCKCFIKQTLQELSDFVTKLSSVLPNRQFSWKTSSWFTRPRSRVCNVRNAKVHRFIDILVIARLSANFLFELSRLAQEATGFLLHNKRLVLIGRLQQRLFTPTFTSPFLAIRAFLFRQITMENQWKRSFFRTTPQIIDVQIYVTFRRNRKLVEKVG